jgi:hypothetical protein
VTKANYDQTVQNYKNDIATNYVPKTTYDEINRKFHESNDKYLREFEHNAELQKFMANTMNEKILAKLGTRFLFPESGN